MNLRKLFTGLALGAALTATTTQEARAVDIIINYLDAPGYGFNDPYLGASRRQAFELAMWGMSATLSSQVPISVDTYFVYGTGGTWYDEGYTYRWWRDFDGGYPGIYYPAALRNKLYGSDALPAESDILITFNGDLDTFGGTWGEEYYYGFDGQPGNDVDFVTISFHAFLRGCGFYTLLNPANGEYFQFDGDPVGGYPDILTAHLVQTKKNFLDNKAKLMIDLPPKQRKKAVSSKNKLKWWGFNLTNAAGGLVPMYAPKVKKKDPIPYGVADHFDYSYGNRTVLSPTYDWQAMHDLGGARWALVDMGWSLY